MNLKKEMPPLAHSFRDSSAWFIGSAVSGKKQRGVPPVVWQIFLGTEITKNERDEGTRVPICSLQAHPNDYFH